MAKRLVRSCWFSSLATIGRYRIGVMNGWTATSRVSPLGTRRIPRGVQDLWMVNPDHMKHTMRMTTDAMFMARKLSLFS